MSKKLLVVTEDLFLVQGIFYITNCDDELRLFDTKGSYPIKQFYYGKPYSNVERIRLYMLDSYISSQSYSKTIRIFCAPEINFCSAEGAEYEVPDFRVSTKLFEQLRVFLSNQPNIIERNEEYD